MLVDSDVLIWVMRGDVHALKTLENIERPCISIVSYMEVMQGCRNKPELNDFKLAIREGGIEIMPLSNEIGQLAAELVEKHALSNSMYLADALIAASAMVNQLSLLSGNGKHFSAIDGLGLKVYKREN